MLLHGHVKYGDFDSSFAALFWLKLEVLCCNVFVYSQRMPVPFPDLIREKSSMSP